MALVYCQADKKNMQHNFSSNPTEVFLSILQKSQSDVNAIYHWILLVYQRQNKCQTLEDSNLSLTLHHDLGISPPFYYWKLLYIFNFSHDFKNLHMQKYVN